MWDLGSTLSKMVRTVYSSKKKIYLRVLYDKLAEKFRIRPINFYFGFQLFFHFRIINYN